MQCQWAFWNMHIILNCWKTLHLLWLTRMTCSERFTLRSLTDLFDNSTWTSFTDAAINIQILFVRKYPSPYIHMCQFTHLSELEQRKTNDCRRFNTSAQRSNTDSLDWASDAPFADLLRSTKRWSVHFSKESNIQHYRSSFVRSLITLWNLLLHLT